jgi:hypothetical protein
MTSSRALATLLIAGALSLGAAPAFAASDPTSFVNENNTGTSVQGTAGQGSTSVQGAGGSAGLGGASGLASTGADEAALTDLMLIGAGALTLGVLAVGATSPAARRARRRAVARLRR